VKWESPCRSAFAFLCVLHPRARGFHFCCMTQTPDEAISGWLRIFANEFLQNRRNDIVKRGLVNSTDLIRSLSAKVNTQPDKGLHFVVFFAKSYGRLQDMRRRYNQVGGEDMVEALKQWAENEGLAKFQGTNRGKDYAFENAGQPRERVLNRIAWGIIRNYANKGTAPKRSWWNKGKTRDIEVGYDLLIRIWSEAAAKQNKQAYEAK
jgi:hypothetical protein